MEDEESGLRIRRARPDDNRLLTRLERAASEEALAHIFPPQQHPYPANAVARRWRRALRDRLMHAYLLEVRDSPVGYVAFDGETVHHLGIETDEPDALAARPKAAGNLGPAGEPVDVPPGYLRNYLLPRKLAQSATQASLEDAERKREASERAAKQAAERAGETAALLSKTVLTIQHRAGEDGKLYGSVTAKDIGDAIRDARSLKVDRRKINLEQPIHETGTYMVEVEVSPGVKASVKTIVAEEK